MNDIDSIRAFAARAATILLVVMIGWATAVAQQDLRTNPALLEALRTERLNTKFTLAPDAFKMKKPYESQAAGSKEEDGPPSGPDPDVSPVILKDEFAAVSDAIADDFDYHIPYSFRLIRDHTSLNTYYFFPSVYLLKRHSRDGYAINFLHRTREDESADELIVLTFTLSPRHLDGALPLLSTLADYAIKPLNDKPVDLDRLPISSVKVSLAGISQYIPEENVRVINRPGSVGEDIRVQATMTQAQKEDLVAAIRSGGLSGMIEFGTNNESFVLEIPYFVSFTDFAGEYLTDIEALSTKDSLTNVSPFPIVVNGIAAFVKVRNTDRLQRHFVPLNEPTVMGPGTVARSDKTYDQLFNQYGEPVATWAVFDRLECEDCLNLVEREILVSPAMASRTELPIEVIPSVFAQHELFKILVEVRSEYFSPSGDAEETRSFTLREDETRLSVPLYVDRAADDSSTTFSYRIRPFHAAGEESRFSEWRSDDGLMDITVHTGMIQPLLGAQE